MTSATINAVPRSRRYWLLIAAACLVPALLDAFKSYMNSRLSGQDGPDWGDVIFAGSEWLFLGALTPITYVLARRYPLRREALVRTVAIHFAGAIMLCIGWASMGVLLSLLLNRYPAQEDLLRGYIGWVLTSLPWSVFMYFTILGCIYAFTYYREARERESQQSRLAAQLAEARLSALRMQLNPHFLFNSLNTITVLVRDQKTREASRVLELLSGVLRQVLQSEKRQHVALDEELRFIEQYLAIEQVRFSDRLQVRWSIEPSVREALVPEFILQPLVENAVRHGVLLITYRWLIRCCRDRSRKTRMALAKGSKIFFDGGYTGDDYTHSCSCALLVRAGRGRLHIADSRQDFRCQPAAGFRHG